MILTFHDQGTADIFNGCWTHAAMRVCPGQLKRKAQMKLEQVNICQELQDLGSPPGNHLEALKGDRQGQHSIRINRRYRICFRWTELGPMDVEIVDYH